MKIFLFDVDGVLIRVPMYFSRFLDTNGFPDSSRVIEQYYGSPLDAQCLEGAGSAPRAMAPFLERIGWKESPEVYFRRQYAYETQYVDRELLELIRLLRGQGYPCFLATDQDSHRARFLLDGLGFRDWFDGWFISCELGYRKVQEGFWNQTLRVLRERYPEAAARDIFYIDDLRSNLDAAEKKGISTFHVEFPASVEELKGLIRRYIERM